MLHTHLYIYSSTKQKGNTEQVELPLLLIMSEEDDDDTRQYKCLRKYELIVKQFDELIDMVDARTRPVKRRRVSSSSKGSSNNTTVTQHGKPSIDEVFVQTITRFLHELKENPTSRDCSPTIP